MKGIYPHLPADPAGDLPDLNVGRFEQHQGPRFLQSDEGLPCASEGPCHRHLHLFNTSLQPSGPSIWSS